MFSHKIIDPSGALPSMRIEEDSTGGVTLTTEGKNGEARFLSIEMGGGHYEVHSHRVVVNESALETVNDVDDALHVVIHED